MTALLTFQDKQLALIRRTVAKDCDGPEFDLFIHTCQHVRLDPLRKQIFAFVFNKHDPKKRQMTIVTSIGGYRSIADRTGNYRPGPTSVEVDASAIDEKTNPKGIVSATATVFKFSHGDWHAVTETAYWEEFAPLKEVWENDKPTGRFYLDPKKDGWKRMPRVMIEKCAEARALRRTWPDDFAGLEVEDEVDRRHSIDLTASELADTADQEDRFARIGGKAAILVDWIDGQHLQREPVGQLADKCLSFVRTNSEEPMTLRAFQDRNRAGLQELWAHDKDGALEVRKAIEAATLLEAAE